MVNGGIAVMIGLVFLLLPIESMSVITTVLGYLTIASGLVLGVSFLYHYNNEKTHFAYLLEGLILIAIGLFMLIKPKEMLQLIILIIGIWVVIAGLFQVYYSFLFKSVHKYYLSMLITGTLSIALGLFVAIKQEFTIQLIGTLFGVFNLVVGLVMLYFGYVNKRSMKTLAENGGENIN